MKSLLILIAFLFSLNSFAGVKYFCKENTEDYNPRKIVITQIGEQKLTEGPKYPFLLEIFDGQNSKPTLSQKVVVEIEDVMFQFKSTPKKIEGVIFYDELDQSWIKIGKEEISFDCN